MIDLMRAAPVQRTPVVSATTPVLYDGYGAFIDNATDYLFLLVDGIAYFVTSPVGESYGTARCLDASTIPLWNTTVEALNELRPYASDETIKCSSGSLVTVSCGGADFALCAAGASGFTIYGSDLDIAVEYLDDRVEVLVPTLDATAECEAVVTPTSVTDTALALLTGGTVSSDSRRKLNAEANVTISSSSCSCSSTPRPCIFFRGMGSTTEYPTLQTTSDYWAASKSTPRAARPSATRSSNTVDYPWTDASQQQKVFNFALSVSSSSSSSSRVVADTIVVKWVDSWLLVPSQTRLVASPQTTSKAYAAEAVPCDDSVAVVDCVQIASVRRRVVEHHFAQ